MIYILRSDTRQHQVLTVEKDEDTDIADVFDGRHLGDQWTCPRLFAYVEDTHGCRLPQSDSPGFLPGIPILSRRAVTILKPLISLHGEFLPINCREQELYAFNVTTVVDGLDLENSDYETFRASNNIMVVNKYVFISSAVEGLPIFKIVHIPRGVVFVNDDFVDLVHRNSLTGFLFTPAAFGDLYYYPPKRS